jgi:hypothetical protein
MAKRTLDGASYSPWQLLGDANAYYALSRVFTEKVPQDIFAPGVEAPDLHEALASATNRVLALELYLKSLLVGAGVEFPADHDLPKLFQCLPLNIQAEVEAEFNKRRSAADEPKVCAETILWFQLTQSLDQQIDSLTIPKPVDTSLAGLLERNRRAFIESRYMFDQARFDAPFRFVYEHLRLAILCSVLCNLLEQSLLNRSPGYKRAFKFEGWDV